VIMLVVCQVSFGGIIHRSRPHFRVARGDSQEIPPEIPPEIPEEEFEELEEANNAQPNNVNTAAEELQLMRHLFENYDRKINPLQGTDNKLFVHLGAMCSRFDERDSVLTSRIMQQLSWSDSRLQWNPDDYNGVRILRLHPYYIWTPDMKLWNSMENDDRDWVNVVLLSSGTVWFVPDTTYKTVCRPGRASRSYQCSLQYGSWTYDSTVLPLEVNSHDNGFSTYDYDPDCPWTISNVHSQLDTTGFSTTFFESLNVTFVIQPTVFG
jgi:hypothetical protein